MKLGLALCGGGVRGAAHIGALKAFEENGIKFDAIGGTSAGSIVSALYALGYTPDEMIKLFTHFSKAIMGVNPKYFRTNIRESGSIKVRGLISGLNLEITLNEAANQKGVSNISDIKMPIIIPATDLIKNKKILFTNNTNLIGEEYITDIEVGKAVRASSSFPGVYNPLDYKDYQFVDGSIFDNLPVESVRSLGVDKVLAIKFDLSSKKKNVSMYNIAMQAVDLMTENLIIDSVKSSDSVLEIDLNDVKPFSMRKMQFCYEEGYKQTKSNIEKIKEDLMI